MKKIIFILCCLLSLETIAQDLQISHLRCEYRLNPLGVQTNTPNLSWQIQSSQRNILQNAYQILVADTPEALAKNQGNVWDSGKILSDNSIQVKYQGKPLLATKTYFWKVKIWDNQQHITAWSKAHFWQMGLLSKADWKGANWIAYEKLADTLANPLPTDGKKDKVQGNNILPIFRKSFAIAKTVKKATMFIAGLGHFEMSLNGKKVGDHFLDAGWTKYNKQAQYVTFDLTKQIQKGENVVGVMLGNGFYYIPPVKERYRKLKVTFGYPKMICRLALEYSDGSKSTILSDNSWKMSPSPITFSSIYGGENYNANLEQKGWDTPTFNDQSWKPAKIVDGDIELVAQMQDPIKVFDNFSAKSIKKLPSGNWIYDLGQNASGIIQLKVKGKMGDTVRVIPAELLKEDGSGNQKASGSPYYFEYILKGDGIETWQPRFSYYGFRYLEVKGATPQGEENPQNKATLLDLKGLHIRNAAETAGDFSSSNELFNKTKELIDWGIKSNMVSVFTDCPHREKLGWLEELHLVGSSVHYNYQTQNLFKKGIQDMKHSQTAEGLIPEIAPEYVKFEWGGDMFRDSPEWGSSGIIVPWYLYEWYGEKRELEESYPMMKRYVDYLITKGKNNILTQGLGDWYDLGPKPPGVSQLTPMGVTGTAIFYYDLTIMEKIANILGKTEDAKQFKTLSIEVKNAFNKTFFNPVTKQYATGSQTANAMAVYMKLVEPEYKEAVIENLIQEIKGRNNSLTAGDIGYRYVLRVLEDAGRSDVIFDMNNRSDVPGYGYQLAKGATALTESWQALPTVSNNHFMLGHLMEWFYAGVLGIKQPENSQAFKQIEINPQVVGDLTFAKGYYDSPFGKIQSEWKKNANTFELKVSIPANTSAKIYLPSKANTRIKELITNKNIKQQGFENGKSIVEIGSGNYHFIVEN
ncbi:family 78 glycoside hydrolase catalytic domain [Arcicella lustrica]|uniref:alpha-L-rhamnosidase n=1 Tax=Arcicella lustrica TaxID=2984196 RepID=A0ABU5SHH3_9BACT|nr:family 78 glycoside hydrolase catalytic domain [Arcicella sp. DC25W]MEA5426743.1 family 78 glycoside hydrolase catalytic domain [Arcicella sp. DC25W]